MKKYFYTLGVLVLLVISVLLWALLTRHLPKDKAGYRYEYIDGQIIKIKDFVPPPRTQLMQKEVNGMTVNYYGVATSTNGQ